MRFRSITKRKSRHGLESKTKEKIILLLLMLLCAAFMTTGCSHGALKPSSSGAAGPSLDPKQEMTTADEQKRSDISGPKDISDDFFEDEFKAEKVEVADPFSFLNRAMFNINDKLYFCVLKPLAMAYRELTPQFFRTGVKNFFNNIFMPVRFVNCILQGKGKAAEIETVRFVMNTSVGLLGLVNAADGRPGLASPDEEDMGQTFGRYGIGNGFYIVWPLIGPSTLRDSIGRAGDYFLSPLSYVDSFETSLGIKAVETINKTSFHIGEYEALKKAAIDPYIAFRDIYLQYRKKKVEK
jgi:phospholipid-binding lipoprotein MlaA